MSQGSGPSSQHGRSPRAWTGLLIPGMIVGSLLALSLPVWLVGPYLVDDWWLDRIVRIVALDWRDFGEERARARLEYELDHHRIGMHVRDDDCLMRTQGSERSIRCGWETRLSIPATGLRIPLSFVSEVEITASGDLKP